jgi:hypothetical protein
MTDASMSDARPQPLLLRGFAPLALAVGLALLAILLVPSVAPEQVVVRPAGTTTTSAPPTTVGTSTTVTTTVATVATVATP